METLIGFLLGILFSMLILFVGVNFVPTWAEDCNAYGAHKSGNVIYVCYKKEDKK